MMKSNSNTPGWSTLHDLALLFLSLTHGTDAELVSSEVEAGQARLRRWFPQLPSEQVRQATDEVMLVYLGQGRDQMVQTSAEAIRQSFSPDQRIGILNDLAELASADGVIAPGEVAFIQQLAAYWGLDRELGSDDAPSSNVQP